MNLVGLIVQFLVFISVLALVFLTDFAESTGKFTPHIHPSIPAPHHYIHGKHKQEPRPKHKMEAKISDFTWDLSGFFKESNLLPQNGV